MTDSVVPKSVLNLSALDKLLEWGGPDLKKKMIELFFENAPGRVDGVREGLAHGDLELAERSAHSLKSSAANLGAELLRLLSGRMEELLEQGDETQARELLPELEQRFAETMNALGTVQRQESE